MTPSRRFRLRSPQAFTFVEAIFTIAIIGIMSALALSAISNGTRDANRIIARQQQAVVQEALNMWVMSQTRVGNTAQVRSLASIRSAYNTLPTTEARFNLLIPNPSSADSTKRDGYLDSTTANHFLAYKVSTDRLNTSALNGNKKSYLTLPDWKVNESPTVEMVTP